MKKVKPPVFQELRLSQILKSFKTMKQEPVLGGKAEPLEAPLPSLRPCLSQK